MGLGRAALEAAGVRDSSRHTVVIEQASRKAVYLLKRSPFRAEELAALEAMVREHPRWSFLLHPSEQHDEIFTRLDRSENPRRK